MHALAALPEGSVLRGMRDAVEPDYWNPQGISHMQATSVHADHERGAGKQRWPRGGAIAAPEIDYAGWPLNHFQSLGWRWADQCHLIASFLQCPCKCSPTAHRPALRGVVGPWAEQCPVACWQHCLSLPQAVHRDRYPHRLHTLAHGLQPCQGPMHSWLEARAQRMGWPFARLPERHWQGAQRGKMSRRQAGNYDPCLPRCRTDGRQRHQQVAEVGAAQIEFDG